MLDGCSHERLAASCHEPSRNAWRRSAGIAGKREGEFVVTKLEELTFARAGSQPGTVESFHVLVHADGRLSYSVTDAAGETFKLEDAVPTEAHIKWAKSWNRRAIRRWEDSCGPKRQECDGDSWTLEFREAGAEARMVDGGHGAYPPAFHSMERWVRVLLDELRAAYPMLDVILDH